jgi:hypothetical protein
MLHCKRMGRPCNCGKAVVYDRHGRQREQPEPVSCLTDKEVNNALMVLLREWRRRHEEGAAAIMSAH